MFAIDHDLHLHTHISTCSGDPQQTPAALLAYGEQNGLRHLCITDHFWDRAVPGASPWYQTLHYDVVAAELPLPQGEHTALHFGCETDINKEGVIGISRTCCDLFDFVIIPTTHLHFKDQTIAAEDWDSLPRRRALYVERLERLLAADLPFEKIGIAHLTCSLMAPDHPEDHLTVLNGIPDGEFRRLFELVAKKGAGVELNFRPDRYDDQSLPAVLRPYRIAKECGCRFYLGSDAHRTTELPGAVANFRAIDRLLSLTGEDCQFTPFGE